MKKMKTVITAAALSALLVTSNPIGAGTANAWHRHHWRHRHPVGFGAGVGVGVGVDFFIPAPVIEIRERPRFVVVEEVEDVQVAEDVDYDIFYSGGRYWYFDVDEEEWFVASSWGGPFVFVEFDECPVGLFYVPFGFWHVRPAFFVGFNSPVVAWGGFGVNVVNKRVTVNNTTIINRRVENFREGGRFWQKHTERQHEFRQWKETGKVGEGSD